MDIVAITGGRPLAAFSGSSTLYGPFESMAQLIAANPTAAPVVGVAEFAGTYDARGNAQVQSTELIFRGHAQSSSHASPSASPAPTPAPTPTPGRPRPGPPSTGR